MTTLLRAIFGLFLLIMIAPARIVADTSFADHTYKSLDDLDQALETGEISYSDYEELIEAFIDSPFGDVEADLEFALATADSVDRGSDDRDRSGLRYNGSFAQDLDDSHRYVRYHRLRTSSGGINADLSLEQRSPGETIIRSRLIEYRHSRGQVTVGSYNLTLGKGLTQGNGSYQSALWQRKSFASSLLLPIKNRNNGVLIRQTISGCNATLFASHLEGEQFRKSVYGSSFEIRTAGQNFGILAVRQELGRFAGNDTRNDYLAPFFSVVSKGVRFSGESSLGLGTASAHLYQIGVKSGKSHYNTTFFSYGSGYHNLQSGGYAYSDYGQAMVDEVDFSYSDKRSGRSGVSLFSETESIKNVLVSGAAVRWQNSLDGRQCAAVKIGMKISDILRRDISAKLRITWENFDLEHDTDNRRLVSLATRSRISKKLILESRQQIEGRLRSGIVKYPLRTRFDLQWAITEILSSTFTLNFYDSDLKVGSDRQLTVGCGQKITRSETISLWVKGQARYWIDKEVMRDWELRVYCDFRS